MTFPTSGGVYNSTAWADIAGTASDGVALDKVEVSIKRVADNQYWNGTAFADGTENWRLATGTASWSLAFPSGNFPADDDYVVRVRATDTAANPETPNAYSLTYDTAAPNTTITAQPSDPTNATGAYFSFSCHRGRLDLRVPARRRRLVGLQLARRATPVSPTARTPSRSAPPTPPATPTRRPRPTPGRSTPPRRTRRSPPQPERPAQLRRRHFTFSSTEARLDLRVRARRRRASSACTRPKSYTGLAEGSHTFQVRATDAAGNTDATPASYTWTVDTAAPDTTITAQPERTRRTSTRASFSFTSTEARLDVRVPARRRRLRRVHVARRATRASAEGSHTFQVRATDAAGNTDATPATLHVDDRHDGAATPTITAQPSDPTQLDGRRPSPSAPARRGSTFECQLDGGGFAACTTPKSYTGLADGSHTFQVRATDAAGNTDPTPASYTWTIDTAAPDTTITAQPGGPTQLDGADFTFSSSERVVDVRVPARRRRLVRLLQPEELHRAQRRLAHLRGPRDRRRRQHRRSSRELHLDDRHRRAEHHDHRPAERPLERHRRQASRSARPRAARPSSASSTAAAGPPAARRRAIAGLTQGSHTFQVRATDAAGNTDASPASFTWTIDTTDPSAAITFPAAAGFYNTATWNDFSGTASDTGGAALDTVEVSIKRDSDDQYWNGTAFADGTEN